MRSLAALLACLTLVACGSGDEGEGDEPTAPRPEGASLTVTVRPQGDDGPTRRRAIECERLGEGSGICRRLAGLTLARLTPVPPDTACTQIYGGPAVARVRGELRGSAVDERFSRVDGCEIARWDRNRVLLGRVQGGPEP
jgi:hypothetical protein